MQGCHEYAALFCRESRMALSPYFQEVVTRESRAGATRKPHLLRCASENKAVHRGSSIAFKLLEEWKHIIAKPDNRSQVQRGILNYLTQHPHAKDTLQGIIEWWLVDSRQTPGVADVNEYLAS